MGNTFGGRGKKAKVMKVTGETFKLKTPATASDAVKDYPGHVLLDSEAVKNFGIRARPLLPGQDLKPNNIYFLVEMPKFPQDPQPQQQQQQRGARRVRSGIHVSAKDRLDFLMLSKRSVSDLSVMRPGHRSAEEEGPSSGSGPMRVKVRLPRSQVERLVAESSGGAEVAEKIIDLYMGSSGSGQEMIGGGGSRGNSQRHVHWRPELVSIEESLKMQKKKVSSVAAESDDQESNHPSHS